MKSLIVFFSHSENTKKVAGYIKGLMEDSDVFEVVPQEPYPDDFMKCLEVGREQIEKDILPVFKDGPTDLSGYDIIFIGSPNWYNTMVPVIKSFLKSYDFTGKTIAPFCTHGTKGAYKVFEDMKQVAKGASFLPGFGAYSQAMDEKTELEVKFWLTGCGLIEQKQ